MTPVLALLAAATTAAACRSPTFPTCSPASAISSCRAPPQLASEARRFSARGIDDTLRIRVRASLPKGSCHTWNDDGYSFRARTPTRPRSRSMAGTDPRGASG
jgi:hypothetical protein